MPARASMLWMLTALLLLAFPVLNFIYWPQVLKSGVLPPNGDSIGIPVFGSIFLTLIVSPIVIGLAWLCFRRYNPRTRLFAVRFSLRPALPQRRCHRDLRHQRCSSMSRRAVRRRQGHALV